MARIVATEEFLFVAAADLLYRFTLPGLESIVIDTRKFSDIIPKELKNRTEKDETIDETIDIDSDSEYQILCMSISSCKKLLVVATSHKTLILFDVKSLDSSKCFRLPKAPTSITFDSDNKFIVVGDRSGCVSRYSITGPNITRNEKTNEKKEFDGELLLGAISMVLDVSITEDNRYLIVADRDEKAYIIEAFGLGHAHYVSTIATKGTRLFSSGGDNQLREWNIATGELIATHMLTEKGPIKKILLLQMYNTLKIIALNDKGSTIITIDVENDEKNIIETEIELLDICENGGALFGVSRNGIVFFDREKPIVNGKIPDALKQKLATVREPIANYFKNVTHNNMEDYHKRKNDKMAKEKEKKQRKRKNISLSEANPMKATC